MSEKTQQPPADEPKQRTPKGYEIPLPKRDDVMAAFKRIVRVRKEDPPTTPKPK